MIGDQAGRMHTGTRRRTSNGTTSRSEKEEGNVAYVVSMLVHKIEHILLKLEGRLVSETAKREQKETHLFVRDRTKHILEKALEVFLALCLEETNDARDERGANVGMVWLAVGVEGIRLVSACNGGELDTSVGNPRLRGMFVVDGS